MYRHLMVPLDDSPLSVDTVGRAVELARALGAKVTFFHAQGRLRRVEQLGALERVMSPAAFNENVAGEARALLAKAEVVARDGGRAHDSLVDDERPAARGDPRRRRSARLRPDLHGLARPPRRQGI